ncbi:MAG: hypothetical protein AVDCRST_MAG33-1161 [uncultured Thermomicrobiales bacterium]|uniref:UspA domain-containing protein n=1 Tax=uncultured Thermomicrobiales bacterium TaxID=1645740 RepID=A0A6J4ULJ7_9BACT|nr:MAG: hypothetical protein AVDCRST_MAG33-1161 [uncultured Thermomicrobiales bacterium]
MFDRIIVPLDGSPFAEQALEIAIGLATPLGLPIHLVRVTDLYPLHRGNAIDYSGSAETERLVAEEATAYLTGVVERLQEDGRTVSSEVLRGDAAREITTATQPGDLIVLTSHGRTGMVRWFMGSVAENVMRRSRGSVLLHRIESTEPTAT